MKDQINSLYNLFEIRGSEQGDKPAFITPEKTVSYAEFLHKVNSIASGLHQQGLSKGDRLATLAKNSITHIAVIVACSRLGAIAYPANWRLSSIELKHAVDLIEPFALLIEAEFDSLLTEVNLTEIKFKGIIGEGSITDFLSVDGFNSETKLPSLQINQDDPAVIIATAAVAGKPRGAVLSHGNLISVSRMFTNAYRLSTEDRYLGVLPLFHIAGLEYLVVMAVSGGASVILPSFDAKLGTQMMDEHKISLITTFPPMLEQLIIAKQQAGSTWKNLCTCFGILNPPEIIQQYLDLNCGDYWTGYGQTETTGIATLINYQEKPGSAGKVVDGLDMRLIDDLDQDVKMGNPGEIVVKGNLVFSHYWEDEAASTYASRSGWHHTGDMGKMDEGGYLYYVGRKPEKDLIKSGGENIYPVEVENAIRKLPEVAEVCVIGVPDDKWGETVKAVVELFPGKRLDESQLLTGIADHLAAYKKPRLLEFVVQLPRDDAGKVDRLQVKAKYGQ